MKSLLSVLLLALLVSCGAPAPEGEEAVATDIESAEAEGLEVEGEDEEEELEVPPEGFPHSGSEEVVGRYLCQRIGIGVHFIQAVLACGA